MYRTYITNFDRSIYEGDDLQAAKGAAVKACFESVIYENDMPVLAYCPISGWRGMLTEAGVACYSAATSGKRYLV